MDKAESLRAGEAGLKVHHDNSWRMAGGPRRKHFSKHMRQSPQGQCRARDPALHRQGRSTRRSRARKGLSQLKDAPGKIPPTFPAEQGRWTRRGGIVQERPNKT